MAIPEPMPASRWRKLVRPIVLGVIVVLFNVLVFLLPINYAALGNYVYVGVFLIVIIANATVIIPIPYAPVIANVAAQTGNIPLVVVVGALGSVIGESVAFYVGRSGQQAVADTRFYRWVQRQLAHPWRAFGVLFLLAAPPNPLFDVAGLTAGAMGLPYWMFATSVFLGRLVRIALFAYFGSLFDPFAPPAPPNP